VDTDDDNDGIADVVDPLPLDPTNQTFSDAIRRRQRLRQLRSDGEQAAEVSAPGNQRLEASGSGVMISPAP
jgi:hypothetical protein